MQHFSPSVSLLLAAGETREPQRRSELVHRAVFLAGTYLDQPAQDERVTNRALDDLLKDGLVLGVDWQFQLTAKGREALRGLASTVSKLDVALAEVLR